MNCPGFWPVLCAAATCVLTAAICVVSVLICETDWVTLRFTLFCRLARLTDDWLKEVARFCAAVSTACRVFTSLGLAESWERLLKKAVRFVCKPVPLVSLKND